MSANAGPIPIDQYPHVYSVLLMIFISEACPEGA